MQLTLVNKRNVLLVYGEHEQKQIQWWVSRFVNVTPDLQNYPDTDFDSIVKNLVWSRISDSNKITLKAFLTTKADREYLQVEGAKESKSNILKLLREAFGVMVKISVCMKQSAGPEPNPDGTKGNILVFQEGLTIKTSDYCERSIVRANDFTLRDTRFDITIIADISDGHEVICQAKEEISIPLKTTRKILEEGLGSDVVIIAGNGAEIKSHKSFLIASSPVLQKMFLSELEESKTGRVEMTDLSEEGVKAFLGFLYYGCRIGSQADFSLAFELLYASHKYAVSKLEEIMILHWMKIENEKIDLYFAFKMYMFVSGIPAASQLKAKMVRILHRKYDELKGLPEYRDLYKTPSAAMELCEDLVKASNVEMQ